MVAAVSVVMPAFNAERFIGASIESALNQDGCEVEIIVVDDGSTDRTEDIVKGFGDRVRYIRQTNSGPAAARNRGISVASHEWVAFLDADDLWEPQKLRTQLQIAEAATASVVYTNVRNFGDEGRVGELRLKPECMPRGDVFVHLLMDNFITLSTVIVRKDVLQSVGGFREEYFGTEDWDLWLRLAATGATFEAAVEPLVHYRWESGSVSKNHQRMKTMRETTIRSALAEARAVVLDRKTKRRAIANVMATSAWFIENTDPKQALWWSIQSLLQWPYSAAQWKASVKQGVMCLRDLANNDAGGGIAA